MKKIILIITMVFLGSQGFASDLQLQDQESHQSSKKGFGTFFSCLRKKLRAPSKVAEPSYQKISDDPFVQFYEEHKKEWEPWVSAKGIEYYLEKFVLHGELIFKMKARSTYNIPPERAKEMFVYLCKLAGINPEDSESSKENSAEGSEGDSRE